MPAVSLTDFGSQQAEVDRRRRMAELLQQQAAEPIQIQSYRGTQAPIPWTAVLGKALDAYAGAAAQRKANKEEATIKARARDEFGRFIREQQVDPGMTVNEGMIMPGDLKQPGLADRLKGALQPQQPQPAPMPPQASPQALGAALAGQPATQQPAPPVIPVQQGPLPPAANPQALGAALAGQPPQAVSAMPPPQPELSQADVMPQQAFDPRRARPMAEQQDRLLQAMTSGNPYLEKVAPSLYEHNVARADKAEDITAQYALKDYGEAAKLRGKLAYDRLKPEEKTALRKNYEYAQTPEGGGYKGSIVQFANDTAPPVVAGYGADVYRRGDINAAGNPVQAILTSIRGIEAKPGPGGYLQTGPVTKTGDRAYGAYGVMGANVGPWTKEVLGVEMTPQAFLANPQAQDKVAQVKVSQLYDKYGNAGDVASMWHAGVPLAQAGDRGDVNMKTTDYAARVAREAGGGAPVPVARGRDRPVAEGAEFDQDTLKFMAAQALAGDKSVFTNLGRGAQGAKNIAALRQEVMRQAKEQGLNGGDVAQLNAAFFGAMSEARAVGTRSGAADVAAVEVPRMATMSQEAYAALPRGEFVPFNKLRRLVDHNLSSPEQGRAYAADVGLITAWARALNPQGVPREADIAKGERILDGAQSAAAHQAVVLQMRAEAEAILAGTRDARANLQPGGDRAPTPAAFRAPAGSMWSPSRRQYKLPNGSIVDANGRPVTGG